MSTNTETGAAPAAAVETPPITRRLAETVRAYRFADLPPDVVFLAKQCLLDWAGVALAGAREPLTRILVDDLIEQGGNPQATVVGHRNRLATQQAALVNGAASHALDFDDVQLTMHGHPSVPVAPALLALAEHRGATGREFITAFVAGVETECRMGMLMEPGHYDAGWHATGTLGTFGAAAACAHLLRLDTEAWQQAFGIAGTQAAGLKSMFGTMCKPFHAGHAAQSGLLAAALAARGFTSNPEVLDPGLPGSFAATETTTPNLERALDRLGESFAIRDVLFKYHAACYGTHPTIEGLLRLRERHGFRAGDVRAVRLRISPKQLFVCNIAEPRTALEGKFSLRFTAALALAGADTGERGFSDAIVSDPSLTALRDRVTVETGDPRSVAETDVFVSLTDGRELAESMNLSIPETDLDRQWRRLVVKFRGLAAPVLDDARAEALLTAIEHLDEAETMADVARLYAAPA
jgi:2-methylcitrate dehydratase PrpD